jgi:osomolarity two-component system response regulator SSK1
MSTAPRLPTVRLPAAIAGAGSEPSLQDSLVLELPHSGKFGFAWPTDTAPAPSLSSLADRHASLSSSDADSGPSEHEPDTDANTGFEKFKTRRWSTGAGRKGHSEESEESDFTTPTSRLNLEQNPLDHASPPLHRLSRAFSVPLPSQIGHLKNPKRSPLPSSPGFNTLSTQAASDMVHFHELSLELADSVQMVIQTLIRLSPPQIFDPAKEQFSACALPFPTPSVSALFTIMKSLNFMSANMAAFSTPLSPLSCDPPHRTDNGYSTLSTAPFQAPQTQVHHFDIGETLQSAGDALSGMAADAAVDLVLYHGDVGMKHIAVRGDEIGLSYTLSHVS